MSVNKDGFDMEQELERVMSYEWVNYRGCIIQPYGDEFKALGKVHGTFREAQNAIDEAYKAFRGSMKVR